MIVARLGSRALLRSVRRAARPDEDVVDGPRASEALRRGFPRAVVTDGSDVAEGGPSGSFRLPLPGEATEPSPVPVLALGATVLDRWEHERRSGGPDVPPERTAYVAFRIRMWLKTSERGPSWVDLGLRDLGRVAGEPLPAPLKGMARRVLEFPYRYLDLASVGTIGGLSAGALKARFRRRGLASPYSYLRWLRCLAVAHLLSDPRVTTLQAAHRVGVSSSGNLCRTVQDTTGLTPTRLRSVAGRNRLLVGMVEELLGPSDLESWRDLADVFLEVA